MSDPKEPALTEPEREVLSRAADGMVTRQIAEALQIPDEEAGRLMRSAFEKLRGHPDPPPPLRSA
jgi:DNA-binding CsgD family transcriptional regulator